MPVASEHEAALGKPPEPSTLSESGRDETEVERADRNLNELLGEPPSSRLRD